MSGKTLFLRTLFSSVYYLNRKIVTRNMQLIVENIGDVRINFVEKDGNVEKYLGEIRCQKEGELVVCDDRIDGHLSIGAYYLSSHREAVIKYGIAVFEPEMSTSVMVLVITLSKIPVSTFVYPLLGSPKTPTNNPCNKIKLYPFSADSSCAGFNLVSEIRNILQRNVCRPICLLLLVDVTRLCE